MWYPTCCWVCLCVAVFKMIGGLLFRYRPIFLEDVYFSVHFPISLQEPAHSACSFLIFLRDGGIPLRCSLLLLLSCFSHVQLFATSWTVTCQAPLSMEFSSQGYWGGLPFPTSGDVSVPRIEPASPLLLRHQGSPHCSLLGTYQPASTQCEEWCSETVEPFVWLVCGTSVAE